jgi:phytoene dehydrogenase-like protein
MDLPIKNLYCVGATVKGGAGIYGAANTGKLCAQKIINQLRKGN